MRPGCGPARGPHAAVGSVGRRPRRRGPPIALGTPKTGTLAPGEVAFFQIDPTTDGRLVAQVHAAGATTRLSLMDAQGQVLMQSDGQSPGNPDDQIDLHVPAGTDYLEVENLGGAGAYTLTTTLTPATTPFQPIPVGNEPAAIVAGDFNRRRPHRPGRRQLRRPTTCRCCWATATAPSRTR